jgi:flavin-dependent dehydrogenase
VIVVGGGPAGSAAAAWLARAGRRVMVVERDQFPRFHIGESLLASVNDALAAIGAGDVVTQAGFPQKWGATFLTGDGAIERYADFGLAPSVPVPQTWQVERSVFDDLLLRHAASSGAEVRQRTQALDVSFDATGVTVSERSRRSGPPASSMPPAEARCSPASSTCASPSRSWSTSPCFPITPASRAATGGAAATSGLLRVRISAGFGPSRSPAN